MRAERWRSMARWRIVLAIVLVVAAGHSAEAQDAWQQPQRELQATRTQAPGSTDPVREPATERPTRAPTPTTEAPVSRPTEPATLAPESTRRTPVPTPETPEPTTRNPVPTSRTPEPTTRTPEPTTQTPEPTTRTPEPTTQTPEPTTRTPEPTTRTPEPTTQTPEPTTRTPEPTTQTPEPTTQTPEPTTITPEPTTRTPEPTTQTPEPTTTTPEPTTQTPEPTTLTPEPTTRTPEPTTRTPEPTIPTPEPTTRTPEPTTRTLEPTISTPEPTTPTPEPKTQTPEPTIQTPEPTSRTPEPSSQGPVPSTVNPGSTVVTPEPSTRAPLLTPEPSPSSRSPEPTTAVPAPTTPTPEPTTKVPEPTTQTPEPTPIPSTLAPEPTTRTPVSRTPEPRPFTREPTPEPTTVKPTESPATQIPTDIPRTTQPERTTAPDRTPVPSRTPEPTTNEPTVKPSEQPPTLSPVPTPTPEASTAAPRTRTPPPTPETPATRVPDVTTPAPTTKIPEVTTAAPVPTTKTPEPTSKVPEVTTVAPVPTTKTPEPTTKSPEPTTKPPASPTPAPSPANDPESPPPPPASLAPAPVPMPARNTSAPSVIPASGNSTTAVPATRPPTPRPPTDEDESPPPVTRFPSQTTTPPRTATPKPISFDGSDKGPSDAKNTVGTVKPANQTDDQAFKPDVTVYNSSSPIPTPVDKFSIPETTRPTTRPQTFDVEKEDEEKETEKPQKYVRGQVNLDEETTGDEAGTPAITKDTNNDGIVDTIVRPNVIGGRSRADPVNANVMSATSADLHDMMRYSGCAFAGISLALLLFFQYVSVDPQYTSAWANNRIWAPNTWEFLLFIGYLQQMGSLSQLSLIKAPYFLWDYTDSYSWTNFLVQTGWEASKSMASDGDGINEKSSRRLTTILIGGVVAYADRLGIKEQAIMMTCAIGLAIFAGVLLLVYFVSAMLAKRSAESYGDTRSTQIMFAQSRRTHRMRNRSARVLGLCVLLWYTALYPLSTFASFEITMQIQSAEVTTGPLLLAIGALLLVCVGGLAVCVRSLWFKTEQELDEVNARGVWAPLCGHFHYQARIFFFFGAICQLVSGIMVGTTDAEPGQLLAVIAVQLIYAGLVAALSPFRASFTRTMTYLLVLIKVANYALAFAFLYTNKSLSATGRRRCAEAFIGLNSIVIMLWFVRHLGMFLAFLRAYGATSRRSDEWQSPTDGAALGGPMPTAHFMPALKQQQYAGKGDGENKGNGPSRETRPVPWELESLPDDMTSAMIAKRGVSVVI